MYTHVDESWEVDFLCDNNNEEQLVSLLLSIDRHLRSLMLLVTRIEVGTIPLPDDDAHILWDSAHDSIILWERRKNNTVIATQRTEAGETWNDSYSE